MLRNDHDLVREAKVARPLSTVDGMLKHASSSARRIGVLVASIVLAASSAAAAVDSSAPALPTPGTAAQVQALVAASPNVNALPSGLYPNLSAVAPDSSGLYYPLSDKECDGTTSCVFASTTSKKTIVLFGDSHAQMWLPALVPIAQKLGYKIVLVWRPGCPAASITVWTGTTLGPDTACNTWRSNSLTQIHALAPSLVLLAGRTTGILDGNAQPTTDIAWTNGLEATISALAGPHTSVAVIGDIVTFNKPLPECLAVYPTSVQKCAAGNPNKQITNHYQAERTAAKASGAKFIETNPWLCAPKVCSPVVGRFAAYFNAGHVSATYAEYLSTVFGAVVQKILKS